MVRPRVGILFSLLALIVWSSSCETIDQQRDRPSKRQATSESTPDTKLRIDLDTGQAVPASRGIDYSVVRVSRDDPRGISKDVYPVAIDDQGREVTITGTRRDTSEFIPTQRLSVRSLRGKREFQVPRDSSGRPRQIVAAQLHGNLVLWKETASTTLDDDYWSIFSYRRGRRNATHLASALPPKAGRQPVAPGGTTPSLAADGRVYYSSVDTAAGSPTRIRVYSVPVNGNAGPRAEAIGSGAIARGWSLYWVRERGQNFRVVKRDLRNGALSTVFSSRAESCTEISGLAADLQGHVAVAATCRSRHRIFVVGDDAIVDIVVDTNNSSNLNMGEGFVWFSEPGDDGLHQQYLLPLEVPRLMTIGAGRVSGSAKVGGTYFQWGRYRGFGERAQTESHLARLLPQAD